MNEMFRIPLSKSKRNVDALLDGHPVIIEIENPDLAKEFLNEAEILGLDAALIDT